MSDATKPLEYPRPIRLWQIFPLIFIAVYLSHATLLRLPYYWDEAGYYIPAAYDFLRTGSLVPFSTLSNAHPPLPSLYLALWWKTSGYTPAVTRVAMCIVASLALLGVYRVTLAITRRWLLAAAVTGLTLLYPVWFAQSTLAHADLFAAAATLWALGSYFRQPATVKSGWTAALFFALAALSKETAIVTPLALAASEVLWPDEKGRRDCGRAAILLTPILPLAAWFAYHRAKTGFVFGNPEYLRYNATATLDPLRFLVALGHRIFHLTGYMNLFVPVLCAAAAWVLLPRRLQGSPDAESPRLGRVVSIRLWSVLVGNLLFFSVLGGALLTRYLLPLYPLVLLLCVWTWQRRVREWALLWLLSAFAFALGIFIDPPYRFAPEDNLAYRDAIVLEQKAIQQIYRRYPNSTILTAWPVTDDLTKPELGYVRQPHTVVPIDNFSLASVRKASQSDADFTVALAWGSTYEPPRLPFGLETLNRALDERYFQGHRDLDPESIARLLGGSVVWQASDNGQWAAVLHLDRPQLAQSEPVGTLDRPFSKLF